MMFSFHFLFILWGRKCWFWPSVLSSMWTNWYSQVSVTNPHGPCDHCKQQKFNCLVRKHTSCDACHGQKQKCHYDGELINQVIPCGGNWHWIRIRIFLQEKSWKKFQENYNFFCHIFTKQMSRKFEKSLSKKSLKWGFSWHFLDIFLIFFLDIFFTKKVTKKL